MTDSQTSDVTSEDDPFAVFDEAVGVGAVRSPYPVYSEMRAECPVHVGEQWHRFGIKETASSFVLQGGTPYTVVPFAQAQDVLRDGETFSSSILARLNGVIMGRTIIEMDQPDHRRYRSLIQQVFTQKAMESWERDIVMPRANRLIDGFADRGHADLVRELFFQFPTHVIAGMLGLPEEDLSRFHRKAAELLTIIVDVERGMAASQWLYDYFAGFIAQRRKEPKHDIITVLVEAELDGQRLTDDEVIAFLRLLLPAGAETTYRSSGNLMYALLSHPDQLNALRDDRSLMQQAIEEGLRWESPITGLTRITTREVEVGGVTIPEACPVQISTGSANHDEARWDDPEEFDIFREPQPHLAFGSGQHICLGMHLARMEMRVIIGTILDRLPNVRLDPSVDDVHISGLSFRGPASLPVLFDPA